MLQGKKIILGICGSIAAYKSAILVRSLVKEGAEVKVLMTTSATDFITPLSLATLSKNPVLTSFVKDKTGTWNNHVDLGLWADAMIIAPASANTIAKIATGLCDNLLTATYLSARCPVFIAPAMDLDMYQHPQTVKNLEKIKTFKNTIIEATYGELASGLVGTGRMAEPEDIIQTLKDFFYHHLPFKDKHVLITAGPTHEKIDPVRYIGNHSTGKMGFAIAENIAKKGASVTLISGPTSQKTDNANIRLFGVQSAQDMYDVCMEHYPKCDIAILSAAVADYTPALKFDQKLKKKDRHINIELTKTPDIAAKLGEIKKEGQINVGFALETENESENARKKLISKNFDFIVLNSLNDKGAGFSHDTNKITILDKNNNILNFELKNKQEVAEDIINVISTTLHE